MGSPRSRALFRLLAAHRELTRIEWIELRQNLIGAALWAAFSALGALAAWLSINVAVALVFRREPAVAIVGIIGLNLIVAILGAWRARSLMRRPAFAFARSEITRDVRAMTETFL